jgi:glycosyl hydrolase family 26
MYFGATISGESYGQKANAPTNVEAWDLFERHAGRKVAILNQGHGWGSFDKTEMDATHARGAIPLVTMGLGKEVTLAGIAAGDHDAEIEKWAQGAKAWGHPFFFSPWWEMNGGWYAWGRSEHFIPAWRRFHDLVAAAGAANVTWVWTVNSIWSDPLSDPRPYYPGDAYVDWTGLDSYNWGRNPAQPDRWLTAEATITPTLKLIRDVAPTKPVAIVENASSEYGGNKTDYIREMLTTYLPHHPEIGAYLWFNWPFPKGEKRADWPIETSAPAQQMFRKAIQSSVFVPGPISLPPLTKVPPPAPAAADPASPDDLSGAAEMAAGPDVAVAPDGTATVVWSARSSSEFRVFARRIAPDGTPGATQQLSASGQDALAPQVAVAPDGRATVVWMRHDGDNFRIQARRMTPAGAPEEATRTLSGAGQDAAAPQLDVAPDGEATVVWKRWDGSHYLVQVRRVAPDGTSEAAAQRLSEPKRDAVEPQVAVAGDGTATVVWSRFDGEDSIVQTRQVADDGTLEESVDDLSALGESAIQPQVDVGPGGTATVIWNRFDGASWIVQSRRIAPTGELEGSVQNVSAAGGSAAEPQLAVDFAGAATVAWDRFDGSSFIVQARRLDPTGAPAGAAINLSAAGRDAADPRLALAPDGDATVLWSRFDGSHWIVQRRDLGTDGSLGVLDTLSAAGRNAGDPALAWGSEGTLAMTWKRFAGSGDVVQAQTVPVPQPPLPPPPPPTKPKTGTSPGAGSGAIDNSFRIAGIRHNRKRGTAMLTVVVPGPGQVMLDGAVFRRRKVEAAGRVVLRVVPKAGKRRVLRRTGSVRLKLTVAFVPTGGEPNSRSLNLRLRRLPSS